MPIIQTLSPADLLAALDTSVDCMVYCIHDYEWPKPACECGPDAWKEAIMAEKLEDCSDYFITSIKSEGIKNPVCVRVEPSGEWTMGNGHHRLALSLNLMLEEIMVVFSEDGDYMMEEITDADAYGEPCDCGCEDD